MAAIGPRPIKRLLVANRGEIATRILSTARELGLETFATYTDNDFSHTYNADHVVRLQSPAGYLDIDALVSLAKSHDIDAIHPGYGFLSESPELAARSAEAGIMVVGPESDILERTGDKLKARLLAEECKVPVLPALTDPTDDVATIRSFAESCELPIMIKAVDGGGGRGIRLVRSLQKLESAARRAIEESPTRKVFAEKAAVDGFRHVEVQIVGDGTGKGGVRHLWERECSLQRRYQKVVEVAPATVKNRELVGGVIAMAVRMAERLRYRSLGTFEFLLNPTTKQTYFLEINPRVQVEHTITESICSVDIVRIQLQLAQGAALPETALSILPQDPIEPPGLHSIQLRITAEDPERDWSLSVGKIQSFHLPSGNGVRVDTALVQGVPVVVGADFDSVIAKLIVTASTWDDVVAKAGRALEDMSIAGVRTNISILKAIIQHAHFRAGSCDTRWLEVNHHDLVKESQKLSRADSNPFHGLLSSQSAPTSLQSLSGPSTPLRKDDAWSLSLVPKNASQAQPQQHHLQLTRLLRNDFPTSLSAEITHTAPSSQPQTYTLDLRSTSTSSCALNSQHRRGDPSNPKHVVLPFSGKLVEVLVDAGDSIEAGEVVCVVKQMKMELEVRSQKGGLVSWVTEADDDEDVGEGMLIAVVEAEGRAKL